MNLFSLFLNEMMNTATALIRHVAGSGNIAAIIVASCFFMAWNCIVSQVVSVIKIQGGVVLLLFYAPVSSSRFLLLFAKVVGPLVALVRYGKLRCHVACICPHWALGLCVPFSAGGLASCLPVKYRPLKLCIGKNDLRPHFVFHATGHNYSIRRGIEAAMG